MKTLIALLISVGFAVSAYGQWSIGPKVSYGTITQSADDIRIIPTSDVNPPKMAFLGGGGVRSVGFMLHNSLGPAFLQVEALGTQFNVQYSSQEYSRAAAEPNIYDETTIILEVPIAAGFKPHRNIKVGVGPVMEVLLSKDSELKEIDRYVDTANRIDGGFQGLLGFSKGNFNVDLRYVYKFSSVVDGFSLGNDILKLNRSANRLTLSLGYTMGSSRKILSEEELLEKEPLVY